MVMTLGFVSYLTGGETQDRLIFFVSVVLLCFLKQGLICCPGWH